MAALAVIALAGLYFLALGVAALVAPSRAKQFLSGFVGTWRLHLVEMFLRLSVGTAFVVASPRMYFPGVAALFGWILVVSTAALLLLPWRWHQRFAQRAVPRAMRYITPIGIASVLLGGLVLAAVARAV